MSIEVVDVGVAVIKQVVPAKTEPATATTCDDPTISKFGVKMMDGLTIPYAMRAGALIVTSATSDSATNPKAKIKFFLNSKSLGILIDEVHDEWASCCSQLYRS
jgi:hypothetical protein